MLLTPNGRFELNKKASDFGIFDMIHVFQPPMSDLY